MKSNHSHPGTSDDRGTEVAVELDDLGQPRWVASLPVVIGRGEAVLSTDERWQQEQKRNSDGSHHG
jgi:hypothetical protein